jgi:hypothetical protein
VERIYFQPTNLGVYTYAKPRFWRRQFDDATTRAQLRFDVAFGLVIPVLCFIFDPVVFGGDLINDGVYRRIRLFAYAASAIETATLACWLFLVRDFPEWSRPAGGVLAAGAFFSFALGLAILPLSLIGLLFAGIGALGFIPFVTAIIYLRNARRALRLNRTGVPVRGGTAVSIVFGLVFALGVPAAAQRGVTRALNSASAEVLAGGELSPPRQRVMHALTLVSGATFDDLVEQYNSEHDPERRALLEDAYWQVTGKEIADARRPSLLD